MKIEARDILLCVAMVIGFALMAHAISNNSKGVDDAHRALCNEKQQYAATVKSTKQFLLEHPNGIPGISRKVLLRSLTINQKNVYALKDISCSVK